MSLAKGLALSCDIPLLPVKTLLALDMNINEDSPHWVCIHSHRDMVFAQKFNKHEPLNDPICISVENLDSSPVFGTALLNIKIDYTEIIPLSQNVGKFALKNIDKLAERDYQKVSPLYFCLLYTSDAADE